MKRLSGRGLSSGKILRAVQILSVLIFTICFFPVNVFPQGLVDLRHNMSLVKHQGGRNTCSVFSATSLMEYLIKQETGEEVDLSEAYNYWAGKKYALTTNFLQEMYRPIDGLAGFLAVEAYRHGSMLESKWPYENKNWDQKNDPRCKSVAGKKSFKCFTGVPPKGAQVLRYGISPIYIPRDKIGQFILKNKKPVVINVRWCGSAVDNKTGNVRMPTQGEVKQAIKVNSGHVITLVGYDARKKEFIFRNSYGPNWGRQGYGKVPEKYIVELCEVCPQLANLEKFSPERQNFTRRASRGVSGTLVKLGSGAELPAQFSSSKNIKISFSDAQLVYLPSKNSLQISTAGAVVLYGDDWQKTKIKPSLFAVKQKSWKNFTWKINTATKRLYKARQGSSDKVKGRVIEVVEKEGRPERIIVRLEDPYIIFEPKKKMFQLIAGGAVLSHGEDFRVKQIGTNQYHLARKNWRGFFWFVDTGRGRGRLYRVTDGQFGKRGGRQKLLETGIEIK